MKKYINGKVYNTNTAKQIAEDSYFSGGFDQYSEELYQKKTGEFFLHGKGGPGSKYAYPAATGGYYGGEKIIPLTFEEARQWVEKTQSTEKYDEIFGEVADESEEKVMLTIYVQESTRAKLRRYAEKNGVPMSQVIEQAVIKEIEE